MPLHREISLKVSDELSAYAAEAAPMIKGNARVSG
jgi:hypothetical protein